MIEIRTVRITWFVETGFCDGDGLGRWENTNESVPCGTKAEAEDLRDEWLDQGKIKKTRWGELRPNFSYGLFRIRRHEEVIAVRETEKGGQTNE